MLACMRPASPSTTRPGSCERSTARRRPRNPGPHRCRQDHGAVPLAPRVGSHRRAAAQEAGPDADQAVRALANGCTAAALVVVQLQPGVGSKPAGSCGAAGCKAVAGRTSWKAGETAETGAGHRPLYTAQPACAVGELCRLRSLTPGACPTLPACPPARSPEHVQLLVLGDTPLFFSTRDGGWFPTLRVLHQYPEMMPRLRADQGAIKFVLSVSTVRSCSDRGLGPAFC